MGKKIAHGKHSAQIVGFLSDGLGLLAAAVHQGGKAQPQWLDYCFCVSALDPGREGAPWMASRVGCGCGGFVLWQRRLRFADDVEYTGATGKKGDAGEQAGGPGVGEAVLEPDPEKSQQCRQCHGCTKEGAGEGDFLANMTGKWHAALLDGLRMADSSGQWTVYF